MRRGLISWSREEMPVAVLDGRVARLQAAMRKDDLGLVLIYTSFAMPAAVHWVCNFTPYWSEAMLAVLPDGKPFLLAALTQRVHPWMRDVSNVSDVIVAPKLGVSAATLIADRVAPTARIGVVGLDQLSWSVMAPLAKAGLSDRIVDASALFASLRQPADEAEIGLARRATSIGLDALAAVPAAAAKISGVTSAIERSARLAGAEEVLQRVAPDLPAHAQLGRMEGDGPLGKRYAVEVSVAYKGVWIRLARSVAAQGTPSTWEAAQAWFDRSAQQIARDGIGTALPSPPPGKAVRWTLEASIGLQPLNVVAGNDIATPVPLPPGSLAVFSVQLQLDDGPWHAGVPLVVRSPGGKYAVLGA